MHDLLAEAARVGEAGEPAALATVIATHGSTPRHAGAHMLVRAGGELAQTIGGGRIEHEVVELAVRVARGEAPAQRVDKHLVHDLAMCCGGKMDLWVEPVDEGRWKALGEAARRRARRLPCVLVTGLAAGASGKDVLAEDACLATRRPRLDGDRFYEPVLPAERLVLFGGGHVALALAPLAAAVGFEVVVCDDDERFASEARFPAARLVPSFDVRDVDRELGGLGPGDYAVILTRDHAVDQEVLERLLPRGALAYLGLIGSQGKLGRFRRRLEAKTIGDEAAWARLRSPVGLDIGAETPEEIAVAIAGELVRVRARGK